jgi:dienelactone hydrolase
MPSSLRRPPEAWALTVSGVAWLAVTGSSGALAFALGAIPGGLLVASGVGALLIWDDVRVRQYGALGAAIGAGLCLPMVFLAGGALALLLGLLSAVAFVASGAIAVREMAAVPGAPAPVTTLRCSAETAGDDALLALFDLALPQPTEAEAERHVAELAEAETLFAARGWLEKPETYHVSPPPFEAVAFQPQRWARIDFEHATCASGYEPHPEEPGRERWLGYAPTRTAHARVMRHPEGDRPWLVCIHGYRMGVPFMDLSAFRVEQLHQRLGLNVLLPVLPLHGPRRTGRLSGDGFFGGDIVDMVHAEAQAAWDLRRWLGWIRAQGAERVGAYGLSLGGYNAALLASLDADLACVIAGIPATDLADLVWEHGPEHILHVAESLGLSRERADRVLRVVSPLALPPLVPKERRFIFGGTSDQLVPPRQVEALARHWDRPVMTWYPGAHITFGLHAGVTKQLAEALRAGGLSA